MVEPVVTVEMVVMVEVLMATIEVEEGVEEGVTVELEAQRE